MSNAGGEAGERLERILHRPVLEVAPRLLGSLLSHSSPDGVVTLRLSEVEAYAGESDPGSHAYRGRTPRTEVMFGPAGYLYAYFTYGMHWCVNVVTGTPGSAGAVLLRAGEVVDGLELARSRRPAARTDRDLARGPARLAQALALGAGHNGIDLRQGPVRLVLPTRRVPQARIRTGGRVGVSGAGGDPERYPWRFWIDADPTVSLYRPALASRRRPHP